MTTRSSFPLSRRSVLGAATGLLAASWLPGRAFAADEPVRFGTYGGNWRDNLDKLIGVPLKGKGVAIEYVLGNPANNVARLVAAGRKLPLDCMEGGGSVVPVLRRSNYSQKIDYDRVPNAKALPAFLRAEYFAGTSTTQVGVVYNRERFEALGLKAPTRMSDLITPKLAGRISFPDISHDEHWTALAALSYDAGGDEFTPEKALPLVNQMNPVSFYESSTDLATKFSSGEIWAAPWTASYAIRLKRANVPVGFSHIAYGDKHHGGLEPTMFHMLTGSPNVAGSEALLDAYLSPDVQVAFARATGTVPASTEARNRVKDDPDLAGLLFSDAELNKALTIDYTKLDLAAWSDRWNRAVRR